MWVLAAGFVALPIVYWSSFPVAHEVPKVFFVMAWVIVLFLSASAVHLRRGIFSSVLDRKGQKLLFAFFAVVAVASAFGADPGKSFWGNYWRRDGIVTMIFLFLFALLVGVGWRRRFRRIVALAITAGAAFSVALSGKEIVALLADPLRYASHPGVGSVFGQPAFMGGYLAVSMPFALYALIHARGFFQRTLFGTLTAVLLAGVIASKTDGALASLMIASLVLVALRARRAVRLFFSATAIAALLAAGIFMYKQSVRFEPQKLAESRLRIYTKGVLAWKKRPWLGFGWANFDYAFASVDWPFPFVADAYVDKAHGHLLEVLVTTGAVGGTLYLLFLAHVVGVSFRHRESVWAQATQVALLVFLVHAQTNVISVSEEAVFWFLAGLTLYTRRAD